MNRKPPNWDVARDGLELKAIQNERDHINYKNEHFKIRSDAIVQEQQNEIRINEIYQIQNDLRNKFIEVNDFIKDCEEKEINADKKVCSTFYNYNTIILIVFFTVD